MNGSRAVSAPGIRPSPPGANGASPRSELRLLPDDMTGMRAIELGCGTAYVSGWMARRGASVTGIDNSAEQLRTAQRLSEQHGVALELIHGNAEAVPKPDDSFDFAISEYGAAIWADPYQWIPEAHRLLAAGRDAGVPREPRFRGPVLAGRRVIPDHPPTRAALLRQPSPRLARRRRRPGRNRIHPDLLGVDQALPRDRIRDRRSDRDPGSCRRRPGSRSGISADWARDFPSEHVWTLRKAL